MSEDVFERLFREMFALHPAIVRELWEGNRELATTSNTSIPHMPPSDEDVLKAGEGVL